MTAQRVLSRRAARRPSPPPPGVGTPGSGLRTPARRDRTRWAVLGERAFTLIELAVVLFLLSLATGLVLPAVGRGVESLELRAQVARFSAFLRYGREQAITKRASHEVRVDPEGRQLTLIAVGSDSPKVRRQLSSRIRISADPPGSGVVTFSPQGFSTAASFRLEAEGGRVYRVTVDPITGRVATHREAG